MKNFFRFLFVIIVIALIILFCALLFEKSLTEKTVDITVIKIEKIKSEEGDAYFLVYTKNEIFENRDHYFHNKNNSKEINSKLEPKGKYRVKVVGFNFHTKLPLFLEHRNIIGMVETKSYYEKEPFEK